MGTPQPSYSLPKLVESRGIEGFPPRTHQTLGQRKPQSSPFSHRFVRGIKGKRITKGSCIHPPTNPQENSLEISPRKSPRKGSENHQKKDNREELKQGLRNHAESSIYTMKVHTRSSLPPDHPSLSQYLTMKLSS
jgi:hypothetical protein